MEERNEAAQATKQLFLMHPLFNTSQHIACYLSQQDEFDCMPIIQATWQAGKKCYLPALSSQHEKHLEFMAYRTNDALQLNRYQILEPVDTEIISPEKLDLVILPLVAFDVYGNRIGMGGGYYDRTFAFKRETGITAKPHLLGLAYEAQKLSMVPHHTWDITLNSVLTEKNYINCD